MSHPNCSLFRQVSMAEWLTTEQATCDQFQAQVFCFFGTPGESGLGGN
jgi:hypothetical protein